MPASKQDKILLTCTQCGHQQPEPRTAISTVCKKCGQHLRVQEVLKPARKSKAPEAEPAPERRRITCFDCGTELEVPVSAESTMCKRCSRYVDLKNYQINSAVSKNFKTKGAFVVETKGYVFNTEAVVGEAVIKGKFLGKLTADCLTLYSTADFKGTFKTLRLIIPAANHFRWKDPIQVGSGEIAGELVAHLRSPGTIVLKPTARLFGDVIARNLVIEEGAIVVGNLRIGSDNLL
jgi:cytoskeletal protein CcmA (bactofilin family)